MRRQAHSQPARTFGRTLALALFCSCAHCLADVSRGCDFSRPQLQTFLSHVQRYYSHGEFHFVDAQHVANILMDRENLLPVCAAAVLQALLLKLEENIVYEANAYEHVMSTYMQSLHTALLKGWFTTRDLEEWPLTQGLTRIDAQSEKLAKKRKSSSALVMNFCAAKDRFGAEHKLQWLLEPPFGDPGAAHEHGGQEMGLLQDTDLYIYLVDAPKCKWLGEDTVEQLRRVAHSVNLVPYKGGPEREEQTAYFKFLSDHYDDLPDFVIFTHPDAPEHLGGSFFALRRALKLIHTNSVLAHEALRYYPLAQQIVVEPKRTWGSGYAEGWLDFWENIFDRPWQEYQFRPPRCRWVVHQAVYIPGLVEGTAEGLSRELAKSACIAAGKACLGITCGTLREIEDSEKVDAKRSGTCSARGGDGSNPLLLSPDEETSYVKSCAAEGSSAHEDAVFETSLGTSNDGSASFVELRNTFLADYADGDSLERTPADSRARCKMLGDVCTGYTCDATLTSCTVRSGANPLGSPVEEVSFLKSPLRSRGDDVRHPAPDRGGAAAVFQFYTGSQSVVHKDLIRTWPRSRLAALGADGPFCSKYSGLYEAVWHAMFGEPLAQKPREQDERLPLFLKFLVPTMYSYGDEGVV